MVVAEADRNFEAFGKTLQLQPIEDYDRDAGAAVVLVGDNEKWAVGYWGERTGEPTDPTPAWRNLQESDEGLPLSFEPLEFATITADQVAILAQD